MTEYILRIHVFMLDKYAIAYIIEGIRSLEMPLAVDGMKEYKKELANANIRDGVPNLTCSICGKTVEKTRGNLHAFSCGYNNYCSDECRAEMQRRKMLAKSRKKIKEIYSNCSVCGREFKLSSFQKVGYNKSLSLFCSDECREKNRIKYNKDRYAKNKSTICERSKKRLNMMTEDQKRKKNKKQIEYRREYRKCIREHTLLGKVDFNFLSDVTGYSCSYISKICKEIFNDLTRYNHRIYLDPNQYTIFFRTIHNRENIRIINSKIKSINSKERKKNYSRESRSILSKEELIKARKKDSERFKRNRAGITDYYVKRQIKKKYGISNPSSDLIELQRVMFKYGRASKEVKENMYG